MSNQRALVCFAAAGCLAACAPALREQDVKALTHVQGDLARRYQDPSVGGPDKQMFKVEYCEVDAVIVAAGKKGAGTLPCQ